MYLEDKFYPTTDPSPSLATVIDHVENRIDSDGSWITYTIVAVSSIVALIALILIYDICSRYRELRGQFIYDGGPPASPDHQSTYLFTIQCESASPNFDTKTALIKIDLLDNSNYYLTTITVPTFVFRFKPISPNEKRPVEIRMNIVNEPGSMPKAMNEIYETWSNTTQSQTISFRLIRRDPLVRIGAIRIYHDCFNQESYFTLKQVIICDEATKHKVRVNLSNRPLKALNPCPPSRYQVFPAENYDDE